MKILLFLLVLVAAVFALPLKEEKAFCKTLPTFERNVTSVTPEWVHLNDNSTLSDDFVTPESVNTSSNDTDKVTKAPQSPKAQHRKIVAATFNGDAYAEDGKVGVSADLSLSYSPEAIAAIVAGIGAAATAIAAACQCCSKG